MYRDEQDIKNEWMHLSGLPIISDDEKYAYVGWLEEKILALKNMESSSRVIERSNSYETASKRIVKVISDLNTNPLKNKLTENQKLEAQMEWEDYLKETIPTSL